MPPSPGSDRPWRAPHQPVPLLKRRLELSREEALKLWSEKRKQGWQPTTAQWRPPQAPAQD
ncbi:MAG: DUF1651 domain-containing protein [Cyanobacteria bacterium]|nr:DUF1651 domain-containing protein [Cyanobacteriota bacterium]